MDKNVVSDFCPTMLAKKTFDQIIENVQSSNLNFQLQLSPFSACISLRKTFVKDRCGNILLPPPIKVTDTELQHENSKLVSENKRLNSKILEIQECKKLKDKTIKMLEEKVTKAETSALTVFDDKKNEVTVLKTKLENASSEIVSLKNEVKAKNKAIKETEKELNKLGWKNEKLETSLRKYEDETKLTKCENKNLIKKTVKKDEFCEFEPESEPLVKDINENNLNPISKPTSVLPSISSEASTLEPRSTCSRAPASSPPCSTSVMPLTPTQNSDVETCESRTPSNLLSETSLISPQDAAYSTELSTLKPESNSSSESTQKFSFKLDHHFDKILELVEAYEKKKKDAQT